MWLVTFWVRLERKILFRSMVDNLFDLVGFFEISGSLVLCGFVITVFCSPVGVFLNSLNMSNPAVRANEQKRMLTTKT